MFDPYKIYSSRKRPSYKGQVLQKKPIALRGSVSTDDYGLIRDYADALGYQLIPKSISVYEAVDVLYSNSKFINVYPTDNASANYTMQNLANDIGDMTLFRTVESSKLKITTFAIVVNICSIALWCPSVSTPITQINTFHITTNQLSLPGATVLYGSDVQNSYYLQGSNFQSIPWSQQNPPPFTGPVDCYSQEWNGPQALVEYQKFQLADASLATQVVANVPFSVSTNTTRQYRIDVHAYLGCKYYPAA